LQRGGGKIPVSAPKSFHQYSNHNGNDWTE
jgi:hypothetical protein